MKQWVRDAIYGFVIVCFSIGNYIYGESLPEGSIKLKLAQAGMYLKWVMILFGILGLWLIIRSFIKKPQNICEPIFKKSVIITTVIVVVYLLILKSLGFVISSVLFLFTLISYYSIITDYNEMKGKLLIKKLGQNAILSVSVTFISYYLFGNVLNVILPKFTLF